MLVPLQQRFQGAQIVRQAAQNLVLFQLVGHRDLHRAVEGQLAVVDPPQDLHGQLHDVIAGQHVAAELRAGLFDLPWPGSLLAAASTAGSRPSASGTCAPDRRTRSRPRRRPTARRRSRPAPGRAPRRPRGRRRSEIVVNFQSIDRILGQVQRFVRPRQRFVFQAVQQCVVQSPAPREWMERRKFQLGASPALRLRWPRGQKTLPPNSRAAGAFAHLAKDSACGENSFASSRNPNRPRIRKAICCRTPRRSNRPADPSADPDTPAGHQLSDGKISRCAVTSC